jgi:16S rRNA (guanine527-N7)-methyltransferase
MGGDAGPVEPDAPGPVPAPPASGDGLLEVLRDAAARGLIGGPEIGAHVRQAEALAAVVEEVVGGPPATVLDLGSGGGLPGLVLAIRWDGTELTLLDGSTERCAFLEAAVGRLGLGDRVRVAAGRAEVLGHDSELRAQFGVVVARAFGPPAVVAECAAPFLWVGGRVVVSEPPGSDGSRWDAPEALAQLGLEAESFRRHDAHGFEVVRAVRPCPPRFPRRVGVPAKRPLF